MRVKDILEQKGTKVLTVQGTANVHEALSILVKQNIGALVVVDEKGKIKGILTERDITRECYQRGEKVIKTPISEIMTQKLIVGRLDDEIDYIMGIMTKNRIRHIPIVANDELKGLISIGDVVKAQLDDREYENRYLKDYMFGQ